MISSTLRQAIRRLFQKGEHSVTRIISLTTGLAFGILLLSEVLYFHSFDSFYPDASRIYVVHENFKMDKSSDKIENYYKVSGAIAPGLKANVPGIETATRLNDIGESVFYTEEKNSYKACFSLADEYLFEVLPRPVISGNPGEILKSPMNCMISDKIAAEMGGDVTGKVIELKEYPGKKLTIAGVFKELPENTNYKYDVLISMSSTPHFFRWDGSMNWLGNDRYYAAVKLAAGVNPESLAPAIRKMQVMHQDIEKLEREQGGMVVKYSLEPIKKMYSSGVEDMVIILTTIALSVLFVSIMNYILLTLSALIKRARSSAIHKTCGADAKNLKQMIFTETALLFLISLAGAFLVMVVLKPFAEAQLGHKLISVLNPTVVLPLLLIIVVLIGIASFFPARFFSRISVVTAFRSYQQKRNRWKLALLSVQFIGASFILTMLVIVSRQYNQVITADHGYNTKGVYYGSVSGIDGSRISTVINELKAVPGIEKVGLGWGIPIEGAAGNNINSPDREKELFNVADFYYIDENYLSILTIPVTEGENFSQQNAVVNDLLISEKGAEKLKVFNGWKNVVGEQVDVSEHGTSTIRGIFPDFIIGTVTNPDLRPSVFFYYTEEKFKQVKTGRSSFSFYILMKTAETAEAGMLAKISSVFNEFLPHHDAVIKSLEAEQKRIYHTEKGFRNAMMAGNAIVLIITVMGLLGYTSNEAARRRKELAVRRINGATLADILRGFISELEMIAIPAVFLGLGGAWFIAGRWMQNFAVKLPLHWSLFAICSLFILLLVAFTAAINYIRTASQNPVEALRYE
ncbi:MAG: ABC transporter permease [Bacteroidia bacterium]|nr:ABC transporter permease [Bacteroidia bacterium]